MMSITGIRGDSEENGSWKTMFMSARTARSACASALREVDAGVAPVENRLARCGRHRADDAAAEGRLAGSGFTDERKHLTPGDVEGDIVDRFDIADDRRSSPRSIGKYFFSARTLRRGAASTMAISDGCRDFRVEEAGCALAGSNLAQRRHGAVAHAGHRRRAARDEAAGARLVDRDRHVAADRRQTAPGAGADARHRAHQGLRVGVAWRR